MSAPRLDALPGATPYVRARARETSTRRLGVGAWTRPPEGAYEALQLGNEASGRNERKLVAPAMRARESHGQARSQDVVDVLLSQVPGRARYDVVQLLGGEG